ncbi:MAG: alpha/beta hydrolase family protein, partial [Phycisphaerae bacterium]
IDEQRYIRGFTVSPDGRCIAMHSTPDSELITNEGWSRVDIYDTMTKEVTTLPDKLYREQAPSPYGWLEELAWSSDSRALAFTVAWDGYPNEILVAEWRGDEPTVAASVSPAVNVRKLTRPDDETSVGAGLHWRPNSRDLCILAERRARQHVLDISDVRDGKQGRFNVLTPGDVVVHSYRFSKRGGRLAAVISSPTHARDVFLVNGPGDYVRLTDNNPQMATWKMPQISLVTWTGANGDQVEGLLELPYGHDLEKDGPLPMIVELHGGPTASSMIGFRYWCYGRTIMPANGYALFSPNYRGSTGYGDKFMTELIGRENDIEVEDILAGVEAMVERGVADPERLGVIGWSNGGFLTNAVITRSGRFKAASSGAGIVDMLIQWGIEDTPGHVVNFMRGLPWEKPEAYRKASPVYSLNRVTTPTLIHCGGNDARVPLAHSRTLYRALHKYCDVPAMLLVYPDQEHSLAKCSMRQAKMEWDLAWFERYILGESGEEAGDSESQEQVPGL